MVFWNGHGHPARSCGQSSGFTLIEVMVALSILAFGILAIASSQASSLSGTNFAGTTTAGTTSAMDRMEQLIAKPYSDADLTAGNHGPVTQGSFTLTWTVALNTPLSSTKTITATATWNEKGVGKSSSLTYVKMDLI
jgi:type IV pilus assembly protein PilV